MKTYRLATITAMVASSALAAQSGIATSASSSRAIVLAAGHYYASHIYVVNPDGTGLRTLARSQGFDGSPRWSPDKSRIAFVRRVVVGEDFRGDSIFRSDLWVMDANGGGARRLARNASEPAWSRDGSRIAFVRDWHVWSLDVDGGRERQLTSGKQEGHPDWSPDGRRVVYEQWLDPVEAIYVMEADGSDKRRLGRPAEGAFPAWSPDGRTILFQSYLRGDGLFVVGADGRGLRKLAARVASKDDLTPDWSPDGRQILFERDAGNGVVDDLFTIRADGTGLRKLARNTHVPVWSPNGREIAYVKSDHQLHVVDAQAGTSRRIARLSIISSLDW